jgi:hypothetical protein
MTRGITFEMATFALFLMSGSAGRAGAQRASIALGAAVPVSDYANIAGLGIDLDLQARTEPMIGPIALRLDITYDRFASNGGVSGTTFSTQSISFLGDIGTRFYWVAGPGYYQSSSVMSIAGHNLPDERKYMGAQLGFGMNIPVIRWEGFLEVAGVKLFAPGPSKMYVPLRFGIRL